MGICGKVRCVAGVVEDSGGCSHRVLKYVVCLRRRCDGWWVFCLNCEAWICRYSCIGSVSVSSCRCCMFAGFCISCSLSRIQEATIL